MGREFHGLLDSGASYTIFGKGGLSLIKELKLEGQATNVAAQTADGTIHPAVCKVDIPFKISSGVIVVSTLIIPSLAKELLLGIDFWNAAGIRPQFFDMTIDCNMVEGANFEVDDGRIELNAMQKQLLQKAIESFELSKPDQIGCTSLLEHNIDTGDNPPVVKRAHVLSPYIQKEVDKELDRMLKLDVVEPAQSAWANPIVVVRKASGKVRLCLDARGLNAITVKDRYPLQHIGRVLGQIRACKFLTSVDLSDAFWQVRLNQESRKKTAFNVPGRGHFQFVRLPFGLCNSAQTLCKALDKCIGTDLEPDVFVYIDDIIIVSDSFPRHIYLLHEVAKRLKAHGFTISSEKSKFCVKQLKYLGYILDENGLKMDPEKISPILNLPSPKNVREVRRIVGMAGWYGRFIKNFSQITSPITDLVSLGRKKFVWTPEADAAFMKLKTALVSSPVLKSPNFEEMFTIQTDASDVGIGAVLTQGSDKDERVIAYMSMKLTAAQKKYSTTERECLAVLEAILKFRNYVEGTKFRVITDHASLLWLRNLKDPTSRLARWALKLQQYDFDLIHRKGKLNVVADALSRFVDVDLIDVFADGEIDDDDYLKLQKKILDNPSKFPKFYIRNDLIFKKCRSSAKQALVGDSEWRLYVPKKSRIKVLDLMHDRPLGAHLGQFKTLSRIREKYYWPNLAKDVEKYVNSCELCQRNKYPNKNVKVPMGEQKECGGPWETIAVDFLGQFPRSKRGNRYLFVVVDVFSKFCLLKPMRQADACSMAKFLEDEVFLMFGVPSKIVSDNGPQFVSKIYKDLLDKYKITASYNAAYHPQHNPAERVNRVVLGCVRSYIQKDHTRWDDEIPKIACAIRTAEHVSAGFSPYVINFGRTMQVDGDRLPKSDKEHSIEKRQECLEEIRDMVRQNLNSAYNKYSRNYNLRSRVVSFAPGGIVLKKSFHQSSTPNQFSSKLASPFTKCRVREKIGACTYLLESLEGKVIGKFHANDMQKFNNRENLNNINIKQ